jgi:hypothetical protein
LNEDIPTEDESLQMSKQAQKYHLSLAGEFYVAAELQRRGISAAVTYGNAKNADVVAFSMSGEKAVVVEVKSTSQAKWVVGGMVPVASAKPWVFVHMPIDPATPASFYIVLQSELHDILAPGEAEYYRKFKEKHGVEYGDRKGVVNFTSKQAEPFRNQWEKILGQLST